MTLFPGVGTLTCAQCFHPCLLFAVSVCSKLRLALPHKVDSERGTAKWDSKKKFLSITLPIIREELFT